MINILVVDDSKLARKRVIETLEKIDVDCNIVAEASDGLDALEKYSANEVDLVISDIEMPNMDGIELTTKLRSMSKSLQIIVVSSVVNELIKQIVAKDKAISFFKKPLDPKILEVAVKKIEHLVLKAKS
ncbi:MAG: response regulator [Helicobacteraceae bacterium]|nr:response regulator [Helicobacteraceae bacterium]